MSDESANRTVMLQTKVSPETGKKLEAICQQHGYSIFLMLRMFAETLVRFMDDRHNLNEDLLRIIRLFEDIPGWKRSICLVDDKQDFGISEAFYVLKAKGKTGSRLVHVERPMMDEDADGWTATYNAQQILERFVEVLSPSLYRQLRMLAVEIGTDSLWDTVHTIVNQRSDNPDEAELRRQFENNDWERGAKMHDRKQYKRTYTRPIAGKIVANTLFDNN